MTPVEMEAASSFKSFDKAMELPILHDAFTIASKLHEQATHFPTYNKAEAIVSNRIQLLDAELSDEVKTGVVRAVLSLDSFISAGLDKLTTNVPSLAKPTDKILSSTDYIVKFSLAQSGLKLADSILAIFGFPFHQGGSAVEAMEVNEEIQESQDQDMEVNKAADEFPNKGDLILPSDRCPEIETLSKKECRLCSSSMLLCSNLPHLPFITKENNEFQDEYLKVTKEYQDEAQESQNEALDVTKEHQEPQNKTLDVTKEPQEPEDDAVEVTKETQVSKDEPKEVPEYKYETTELTEETRESQVEDMEVKKETEKSQNEDTEVAKQNQDDFTEVPVETKNGIYFKIKCI